MAEQHVRALPEPRLLVQFPRLQDEPYLPSHVHASPPGDREVVLPNTPSLHPLFLLELFTFNLVGAPNEPYSFPFVQNIAATAKLAFSGRFSKEWLEAVYTDQAEGRRKSINWARLLLLFHAAVIAVSIIFRLWMLPVLVTFAPFVANWLRYFIGVPMHTGLRDNVSDFRLCVRTITLDPLSQFIYWRMNWHTEHHMYAAVPCYNLGRLASTIAADMPAPRSLVGAWKEIRETWLRQKNEPDYQFNTPLPSAGKGLKQAGDPLASSLGNLAPKEPGVRGRSARSLESRVGVEVEKRAVGGEPCRAERRVTG